MRIGESASALAGEDPAGRSISQPLDIARNTNLTPSQFLIWLGQRLNPDAPLYNMVLTFRIEGRIDRDRFDQAFQVLLARSDALRTVFDEIDGVPQQRVREDLICAVEHLDFSREPDVETRLRDWLAERRTRRFDLGQCLFDTALIRLAPGRVVWYLNQHHLISDALSFALAFRRMSELYALAVDDRLDRAPDFPPYADYLTFYQATRNSVAAQKAAEYWREKLAELADPVAFFGELPRDSRQPEAQRVSVALGADRSDALRRIAQEKGSRSLTADMSFFHMFTAVLFATLYRLSGRTRLSIGAPFHNRMTPTFRETIGLFINVCPLDIGIGRDETFQSLVEKCTAETLTTLRHAHYQPTDPAYGKAYSVILNYLTASFGEFNGKPTENTWIHSGCGDSNHGLRLQVHDFTDKGEFALDFDFNCSVFDDVQQTWFVRHFLTILDAFVADRHQVVSRVELLTADENQRLLVDFNRSGAPDPSGRTVAQLFAIQADRSPHSVAMQTGEDSVSYEQLNRRANRLGHYLIRQGVEPEVLVGLCLERSPEAVIAMLAVLKAGGAYVVIDPAHPPARLAFLLEDTAAKVVLTQTHLAPRLPQHEIRVFCFDRDEETLGVYPDTDPQVDIRPDNLAYVIYTSGSTGQPKGVMVRHRGLTNYVTWANGHYLQNRAFDFPLFSSLSFDLTVTSIYTPLLSGGRIVVYPEQETGDLAVLQVLEENVVNIIKLTPAHLALVARFDSGQSRLKKIIVGGEDFKRELAMSISDRFEGEIELYNEYGPSETVVGCMIHRFDPASDLAASVPIGRPVANTQIYLLDQNQQPVPPGMIGELVIAGAGVARGYLNRPELSTERFVADPFQPGTTMYRSGDLARWTAGGELVFLGRADHQVKIKGLRIELGEIDAALLRHPAIQSSVVDVFHPRPVTEEDPSIRHCSRCGLPSNYPDATFDEQGVCNTCRDFDQFKEKVAPYFRTLDDLRALLARGRATQQGKHDCLVLLSGGKDSTYMLYQLVRELGATPLVFSLDNGFISEGAKVNIRRVSDDLGVDLVWGRTPHMNAIFADSLERHSNVCNGCFKTIYTLSMQLARERGIRYIVTGLARGQLFETRLTDMFEARIFDTEQIDRTVLEARKAYHRMDDAVSACMNTSLFQDDAIFEQVEFIDFYRYTNVALDEMYRYLDAHVPWIRPIDTGRSTNCLINNVGIYVHRKEQGFHNYALPYSWDVRLGHKVREAAMEELDDDIDEPAVQRMLREIGYAGEPSGESQLTAYYTANRQLQSDELRDFLRRQLPAWMLPDHFVRLETLPLTRNGKVDRKALPDPRTQALEKNTRREGRFAAPRTPAEKTLATIWADVFHLDRVGIDDNFFDLGGDSIISIQIIAKASQAGLHLTPKQLFQRQTVGELGKVAEPAATVSAEQGLVGGVVPLTPIQHWFFAQTLGDVNHWNLAFLLELPPGVEAARLREALQHLVVHHDALRLAFTRSGDAWQQIDLPQVPAIGLREVDLTAMSPADQAERLEATMAELELSHDLGQGRLLGAAYFHYGAEKRGKLFITTHHLAMDGVSWRILLQDLATVYRQLGRGQEPELPLKTTSFKAWAETLVDFAESDALAQELSYWRDVIRSEEVAIPIDGADLSANTESSARHVSRSLSAVETKALLQDIHVAYNTQINDLLLTALLRALAAWTGRSGVLVNVEGHGREPLSTTTDLSRTVGWFTSIYPVALKLPDESGPVASLKAVKEQLRRIPNGGIGYGLLRYSSESTTSHEDLANGPEAQVLFNYLGQLDRMLPQAGLFSLQNEFIGSRAPDSLRPHLLDINCCVMNGQLRLDWVFSPNVHQRTTIERLANGFLDELRALIEQCLAPESGGHTPADFPLARLKQVELDRIVAVAPDIEDIYPLSSLQQGMLFHALYAPDSGFHVLQFSGLLPAGIDTRAFDMAWQEVVGHHAALRTRFVWEKLPEPLQIVQRTATLPIEHEDWRHLSADAQAIRLEDYKKDRWRGFDLHSVPLTSIIVVRLGVDLYRFIWNVHHILFEGWSMTPILADVFSLYGAIREGRPWTAKRTHRFRDYIAWVQRQDSSRAERHWRDVLRGFTRPTPLLQDRDPERLATDDSHFIRIAFSVSNAESDALIAWARQRRLTLNTVMHGIWALLLGHWSGDDDVVFGSVVTGRPAELPGAQTTVGLFMNTLPTRVHIDAGAALDSWLKAHQDEQLLIRQFDYTPLISIQEWSDVAPGRPLFHSVIGVQRVTPSRPSHVRLARDFGMRDFDMVDWNILPLSVAVEIDTTIEVLVKFDGQRFEEGTRQRMARHFETLLKAVIQHPTMTLGSLQGVLRQLDQTDRGAERQRHRAKGAQKLQRLRRKRLVAGNDSQS